MRTKEKTRPKHRPGFKGQARSIAHGVRSVADLDGAELPGVAIPEALAAPVASRCRRRHTFHIDRGRTACGDGSADDGAADDSAGYGCAEAALCTGRRR